jgi:hypothetical protein
MLFIQLDRPSHPIPSHRMQAVSAIAKKHGIKHCCDSTFATPVMLLPLELGCDIALHSTTKHVMSRACTPPPYPLPQLLHSTTNHVMCPPPPPSYPHFLWAWARIPRRYRYGVRARGPQQPKSALWEGQITCNCEKHDTPHGVYTYTRCVRVLAPGSQSSH